MYHARQTMLNVEESDRLSFLPDLFGNDFLAGEMQVYALAVKHITDYCGGFWHFIRIPEGGGYMMPDGDRFHLTNPDTGLIGPSARMRPELSLRRWRSTAVSGCTMNAVMLP